MGDRSAAGRWPFGPDDHAALRGARPHPVPFREFVLKVHQRCNLACDYCYVYFLADQSWRTRPAAMTPQVRTATAARIGEHATAHAPAEIAVVFHGGEPLLAGVDALADLAAAIRAAVPPTTQVRVGLQTNGVQLTERVLDLLAETEIRIGVSLDGTDADHDAHRRYADGRGSAGKVREALDRLTGPRYRSLFAGLLCTIDPTTDPVRTFEALLAYDPPTVDFLLPHANWTSPLPHSDAYGPWLVRLFDRWYDSPQQETRIPLFGELLSVILGGASRSEHLGLAPNAAVIVESDGAIEQTDALKSAYPGAAATGFNVLTDAFDAALGHPGFLARQAGAAALCDSCRDCPIHELCGAGHYAHRFHPDTGFRSPSVYCRDLTRLINHAQRRVGTDLSRPGRHPASVLARISLGGAKVVQ